MVEGRTSASAGAVRGVARGWTRRPPCSPLTPLPIGPAHIPRSAAASLRKQQTRAQPMGRRIGTRRTPANPSRPLCSAVITSRRPTRRSRLRWKSDDHLSRWRPGVARRCRRKVSSPSLNVAPAYGFRLFITSSPMMLPQHMVRLCTAQMRGIVVDLQEIRLRYPGLWATQGQRSYTAPLHAAVRHRPTSTELRPGRTTIAAPRAAVRR